MSFEFLISRATYESSSAALFIGRLFLKIKQVLYYYYTHAIFVFGCQVPWKQIIQGEA